VNYLKLVIKKSSDLIAITYCAKVFRFCSRISWNGKNISVASFEKLCICTLLFASMLTISSTAQASTTWDWRVASGGSISGDDYEGYDVFITDGTGGALDGLASGAIGFSDTGKGGTFDLADMRSEWTGLGVCNDSELGDCVTFPSAVNTHQVDNQGEQDWELLIFEPFGGLLTFDSLVHSPWGAADRDASYWIGTIGSDEEEWDLRGLDYADLASIGFGDRIDTSADYGDGTVTIDFGGAVGNAILIGAKLGDTDDRLKIATVQASVVPIPAAAWLFASGLGMLGWFRKRAAVRSA